MMSESRFFRLKRNQEAERLARFLDDDGIERDGRIIERNGNLTLIEDQETGGQDWRAPHELIGGRVMTALTVALEALALVSGIAAIAAGLVVLGAAMGAL